MGDAGIKMVKLSDVADLTVGYVGTMGKEYTDEGITFLRSLNIKPFSFDLNDIKYIPQEFHQRLSKSELHKDDVVIVRTGIPGTCAVIPAELDGSNCADLVIVRPNKTLVDPYYLCAFINSWGKAQVSNSKVGAVQKHFNVTSAEEMIVPLPELSSQRIVGEFMGFTEYLKNDELRACKGMQKVKITMNISKSKYCNGIQCPRILWLKQHKPEVFDNSVVNEDISII